MIHRAAQVGIRGIVKRARGVHYYAPSHEWVASDTGRVGITEHAQSKLGDVIYVGLPTVGDAFRAGEAFATVDSVKATSDINMPVSGTVVAVNEVWRESEVRAKRF
jgi:glycine cleavage system H protein